MILSISDAARAAHKSRPTLHKYIRDGKISVVIDSSGAKGIDTSELLRVFGELKNSPGDSAPAVAAAPPMDSEEIDRLRAEIAEMRERERQYLRLIEKLDGDREAEREHSRQLEIAMLAAGDAPKKSFFARLFGG